VSGNWELSISFMKTPGDMNLNFLSSAIKKVSLT
jgi:hypothetical protein